MKQPEFSTAAFPEIGQLGFTEARMRRQIEIFRKPLIYIRLNRPST